jgi:hypothetical protein
VSRHRTFNSNHTHIKHEQTPATYKYSNPILSQQEQSLKKTGRTHTHTLMFSSQVFGRTSTFIIHWAIYVHFAHVAMQS